ncbi:hypothetical protein A5830_002545, partial [Enterococcus faecalis]
KKVIVIIHKLDAVSYTHLDVYKRQLQIQNLERLIVVILMSYYLIKLQICLLYTSRCV